MSQVRFAWTGGGGGGGGATGLSVGVVEGGAFETHEPAGKSWEIFQVMFVHLSHCALVYPKW